MPNATLTYDNVLVDFSTACAEVQLGGSVRIGRDAYLGMGSSVREGVTVGQEAVEGMAAVALRNILAGQTWIGVKGRAASLHPITR